MSNKVLKLYKDLLRYADTLKFTDKKYYRYRIKNSFRENKDLEDAEAINLQIEKGMKFLETRRVV